MSTSQHSQNPMTTNTRRQRDPALYQTISLSAPPNPRDAANCRETQRAIKPTPGLNADSTGFTHLFRQSQGQGQVQVQGLCKLISPFTHPPHARPLALLSPASRRAPPPKFPSPLLICPHTSTHAIFPPSSVLYVACCSHSRSLTQHPASSTRARLAVSRNVKRSTQSHPLAPFVPFPATLLTPP